LSGHHSKEKKGESHLQKRREIENVIKFTLPREGGESRHPLHGQRKEKKKGIEEKGQSPSRSPPPKKKKEGLPFYITGSGEEELI